MYTSADIAARPEAVAVVIPAFNEAERIVATVQAALRIDSVQSVVVVDDGSSDETSALAKGAGAIVVRHARNQGKAAAMKTGAQVISLRESVAEADGGSLDAFDTDNVVQIQQAIQEHKAAQAAAENELVEHHTGPLPRVPKRPSPALALLFIDADLQDSAAAAEPLVHGVLQDEVDMAISLLPRQTTAGGGFGLAVKIARNGIKKATGGFTPAQPLSGTRCMTRQTWEACQPLASGWGVETGLTIDAVRHGFTVREIECALYHRVTGGDVQSHLHRAGQLKGILLALSSRLRNKDAVR